MVYDRRPSRDNNYGNSHSSSSFGDKSSYSPPRSTYYSREPIAYGNPTLLRNGESAEPIERWIEHWRQIRAEREAKKEQEWFDSLPVFDLGEESDRDSRKSKEGRKKKQLVGETKRVNQKEKEESEAEESGKKKKKGLFSWLNLRGKGDKQQSGKPKPNQDKNQSNFPPQAKPFAKDKQQLNSNSQEKETNTGVEIGNDPNRAAGKSTHNRQSSNSNELPRGSSASVDSSADVTSIAPVRVEPIFIAPSLDLADAERKNILGTNPDGSVIYISHNPSSDRAKAQAGVGVSELPSSQTERIYTQQQELAQTALDSVKDTAGTAQQSISSTSPSSLARIDSATTNATAGVESEIALAARAISEIMNWSRSSISAASNKEIARVENHYANTIAAIDARTETAIGELEAGASRITESMTRTNATFNRRIESVIERTHTAFTQKQERAIRGIEVIERGKIKQFRKQSPTKSDNPIVRALDNIGWNAYVTNWREAKIQVARGVAGASYDANTELFNGHFAKLAEYRATTINGGTSFLASYQQTLSHEHTQQKNAILQKAANAKAQAAQLKQQLIAGVQQTQSDLIGEVDNTEAGYRQTLEQKKHESNQELVTLGHALHADLATAIAQSEQSFNLAVAGFSKGINTVGGFADLAGAPAAAETAIAQIEREKRKTENEIELATANAEGKIGKEARSMRSSFKAVTANAEAEQRQQRTRYDNQLLEWGNSSDLFARMTRGYSQSTDQTVAAVTAGWSKQSESLMVNYQNAERNLSGQLDIAESQIDKQRERQLRGIANEIDTKAPIEAAKVKPAWKKVVRIIVNVGISVVTTVAIAALALSGVGLVALIGLSALIGAAGGVAKLAANDLIDGQTSSAADYIKAGAIGALTGVIEGLGGRAVMGVGGKLGAQMLTKIEHMVASTGIEAVTNTLVELTEAMGQGQDFTLKLLGISIASSLLSTAGGKYIDFKFSDIGRGVARGVGNGAGDAVADGVTREATQQGFGKASRQFATETAFDTAVETGASIARGEEQTWESFGENLAGGILGRGVAGRADKLYGNKLRGLGNNRDGDVNRQTGERRNDGVNGNTERQNRENNTGDTYSATAGAVPDFQSGSIGDADTTRNNSNSDTPSSENTPRQPVPTNGGRNPDFERVASEGLSVPVEVYNDPDLEGNTVRAEYELDSNGVVKNVHLRAGLGATAADIKLHSSTVKVMRMYGGTLGRVRIIEAKIAKWVGIHGQPQTGTRAWEAQHEVPKLNRIISDRMKTLEEADPQEAQRLELEIENLTDQLALHHRTFEAMDESDGVGYIAAEGLPDGVYTHPDADRAPESIEEINGRWNITIKKIREQLPQEIDNINAKIAEIDAEIAEVSRAQSADAERLEQLQQALSSVRGYLNNFQYTYNIPKTKEEYEKFITESKIRAGFDKARDKAVRNSNKANVTAKQKEKELKVFQEKYEGLVELADPTRRIRQRSLDLDNPVVKEKFYPTKDTQSQTADKTQESPKIQQSKKTTDKGGKSAEVHNHLNGILDPNDLIELAYGNQLHQLIEDVWQSGKNQPIIKEFYKKRGLLEDNSLMPSEKLRNLELYSIADELLAQSKDISFETSYAVSRRVVVGKIDPEKYLEAIIIKQKRDNKTDYFELQGSLPAGVSPETFAKLQEKHGVRIGFLENLSSNSLGGKDNSYRQKIVGEPGNPDKQPLELGKDGLVGVDFAGPEANFTPQGMENFKEIYRLLGQKAKDRDTAVVIRPHVGEGDPRKAYEEKRPQATDNIELMITALEELKLEDGKRPEEERISDNVVVRFGHATHATGSQLERIKQLGVIVEANLTSNLETGAVRNKTQMQRTILKFLYHDVRTIINTDGGGMMRTDLPYEYKRAKEAIQDFKDGKISILVEDYQGASTDNDGNRTVGQIEEKGEISYQDLSPKEQKRFNINRLYNQSREYKNKIVPKLPI